MLKVGGVFHAVLSIAVVFLLWKYVGLLPTLILAVFGQSTKCMCFFPFFYWLYTRDVLGYRVARLWLHPRVAELHSVCGAFDFHGFVVLPIPVLADNYCYLVWCRSTKKAIVIDPADPDRVWKTIENFGVEILYIIATHKHWDHSGGNKELLHLATTSGKHPSIKCVGSKIDNPHSSNLHVTESDKLSVGCIDINFEMVPGHTKGHILTKLTSSMDDRMAVFTGDSLFCCGVGAFFEADIVSDLLHTHSVYHSLPDNSFIFPGHEYSKTLSGEALRVDPQNASLRSLHTHYSNRRAVGQCTVPSVLEIEKSLNPFLRLSKDELKSLTSPDDIMAAMYTRRSVDLGPEEESATANQPDEKEKKEQ